MSVTIIRIGTERPIIENTLDRNRSALIDAVRGLSESDARDRKSVV